MKLEYMTKAEQWKSNRKSGLIYKVIASSTALSLLQTRSFGALWLGETISQIGDGLNKVALLWFVYQLSGSALKTSLVGVLQTAPPLVLGPLIGIVLDRVRKKPLMIAVNLIRTVLVALIPILHELRLLTIDILYILVLVISIVSAFFGPALIVSIPLVISDPSKILAANALIQGTATIGVLAGPVVAGIAVSLFGIANVFYVNSFTFLMFVCCVVFVSIPELPRAGLFSIGPGQIVRDLREGFGFIFHGRIGVLLLILAAGFQNIGASAFVFILPDFITRKFPADYTLFGLFWSALGFGMLLATLSLAHFRPAGILNLLRLPLAALAFGGMAVGALVFVNARLAIIALMIIIGWSAAAFSPAIISLLQRISPEKLRGRVMTTFNSMAMAASMFGMTMFGWISDKAGSSASMVGISAILIITALSLLTMTRMQRANRLLMETISERSI